MASYPLNNPLSKGWLAARFEVRVDRVVYDFSRIDIGGPGVLDDRMRRLSISEMMFIARCPGWRMRVALLLWLIGLRERAQQVSQNQRGRPR